MPAAKKAPRKPAAKKKPAARARAKPAAKKPPARKPRAKRAPAKRKPAGKPSARRSGRIVSIYGPFGTRALVEMPTDTAMQLFHGDDPDLEVPRAEVVDAALRDVAAIAKRDKALGESALAAALVALAVEVVHPGNSASAKARCVAEIREALAYLRELAPPERKEDSVDELQRARDARRRAAGGAET